MLQMRQGDQFIQVAQAGLILCQDYQVIGAAPLSAAISGAGTKRAHDRIDLLKCFYPHILQVAI